MILQLCLNRPSFYLCGTLHVEPICIVSLHVLVHLHVHLTGQFDNMGKVLIFFS